MTLKELSERYPKETKLRVYFGDSYFATYSRYELSIYPVANKEVVKYEVLPKKILRVTLAVD